MVDNDLGSIASGPTVKDETTFSDAKMVLEKFQLWEQLPGCMKKLIEDGISEEATISKSENNTKFRNAYATIIASNHTAILQPEK